MTSSSLATALSTSTEIIKILNSKHVKGGYQIKILDKDNQIHVITIIPDPIERPLP